MPEPSSEAWCQHKSDIEDVIGTANNSMPGPDGIPYMAWRALGQFGVQLLFDAATALASPDAAALMRTACGDEDHDFNLGMLCCLPKKKPTGTDHTMGPYYAAEDTRPLSIVNTDNRLIANAHRIRWEPTFARWVSRAQQGFIKADRCSQILLTSTTRL